MLDEARIEEGVIEKESNGDVRGWVLLLDGCGKYCTDGLIWQRLICAAVLSCWELYGKMKGEKIVLGRYF